MTNVKGFRANQTNHLSHHQETTSTETTETTQENAGFSTGFEAQPSNDWKNRFSARPTQPAWLKEQVAETVQDTADSILADFTNQLENYQTASIRIPGIMRVDEGSREKIINKVMDGLTDLGYDIENKTTQGIFTGNRDNGEILGFYMWVKVKEQIEVSPQKTNANVAAKEILDDFANQLRGMPTASVRIPSIMRVNEEAREEITKKVVEGLKDQGFAIEDHYSEGFFSGNPNNGELLGYYLWVKKE